MKFSLLKEDMAVLAIICIAGAAIGLIEKPQPKVSAEIQRRAEEKKQDLPPQVYFTHPLGTTWVLQAGNDSHGDPIVDPQRRHSMVGDLTERKK